jgi:hypothetical protein
MTREGGPAEKSPDLQEYLKLKAATAVQIGAGDPGPEPEPSPEKRTLF